MAPRLNTQTSRSLPVFWAICEAPPPLRVAAQLDARNHKPSRDRKCAFNSCAKGVPMGLRPTNGNENWRGGRRRSFRAATVRKRFFSGAILGIAISSGVRMSETLMMGTARMVSLWVAACWKAFMMVTLYGHLTSRGQSGKLNLIFLQIFRRHIVLRDLFRVNFSHVRIGCVFHAGDHFGLERLPLFDQFLDALCACLRDVRQPLSVPGLAG